MNKELKSKFASPDRSSQNEISASNILVKENRFFTEALDAFPEIVLILDKNRQIIYANKTLLQLLGLTSYESILGKRPGEAFQCIHSNEEEAGCGTSKFCRECGAVRAILIAQSGNESLQECHMTVRGGDKESSLDLRVFGVPFSVGDQSFIIFTIRDIQHEKRRELLERTFFHDILNEVGFLISYLENVRDGIIPEEKVSLEDTVKWVRHVAYSIQSQRDLIDAEEGCLVSEAETIPVYEFLENLISLIQKGEYAKKRNIVLKCDDNSATIHSDPALLSRVMSNLIKNALEASGEGQTVTTEYKQSAGKHILSVHNEDVIPEKIQLQLFQRSFSTKGRGRGVGTYSVKLFTEQYLKGRVYFESTLENGTTFFIELN